MRPLPLSTSETVLTETPAACATSLMVIFFAIAITAGDSLWLSIKRFINVLSL
jgi:hypothetical protein